MTAPISPPGADPRPARPGRLRRMVSVAGRCLLWTAAVTGWLWSLGALWWFAAWPAVLRQCVAGVWFCLPAAVILGLPRRYKPYVLIAPAILIALLWSLQPPALNRDWSPDQVLMPAITFTGSQIRIRNLRHAVYRTATDYNVTWYDRTFDLDQLASATGVDILPAYLLLQTQDPPQPGDLPQVAETPPLSEGPHFSYAVQWFLFTIIGLVGYAALVRKEARELARATAPDPAD